MDSYEYQQLCDKHSEKLLQFIICPYCGHIYDKKASIDIIFSGDCEDSIRFNCENCGGDLVAKVWCTEYRVSVDKASNYEAMYKKVLKDVKKLEDE